MLIFIIIGIIMFLITLYVHKHTLDEYGSTLLCPLWVVIIAFIAFCIPVIGIILFLVGAVLYLLTLKDSEISFKAEGIIKKIGEILTKEV